MATNLIDILSYIHPSVSGINTLTNDNIWILFDREIDTNSVVNNLFITGLDFDTWSGPDLQLFIDRTNLGTESEILQSPQYHGILQGNFSYERIALNTLNVVSTLDIVGSGHLYRTKAIFTPTNKLAPGVEYTVHLSGDEDVTDDLFSGITSNTVFDTVSGSNTGTGDAHINGSYTGNLASDTFYVEILNSGEVNTSKFQFYKASDPLTSLGPFKTKYSNILLSDGVSVYFDDGVYMPGDIWSVVVNEPEYFAGNLSWPFITASDSIQIIPTEVSTTITGVPVDVAGAIVASSTFEVLTTDPFDHQSNIQFTSDDFDVIIEFDNNIDITSIVSGVNISIYSESVTGDSDITASGICPYSYSVSDKELTLTIPYLYIKENNLFTVTLDKDIESTSGVSLSSDYEFSFTTRYYPMYCTLRRVKMQIGAFIPNIEDDTVNLSIFMASKDADSLLWNTTGAITDYYLFAKQQWTCCKAAETLLINAFGSRGALKSKSLGDLKVEYNADTSILMIPLQQIQTCLGKYEIAILAGGQSVQIPVVTVKGDLNIDRPPVGRGWLTNNDIDGPMMPASNVKVMHSNSRRFRNVFQHKKGWWNR